MAARPASTIRTLALLFFFGVILAACFLLVYQLREPRLSTEPFVLPLETGESEEFSTVIGSLTPRPVLDQGMLEITGRVIGVGLEPLVAHSIFCGSERTQSDVDGQFGFAAAKRPGPISVSLRHQGAELTRWREVVVGASYAKPVEPEFIPRPTFLRWSMTVFDSQSDSDKLLTIDAVLVEEWGRSGAAHILGRSLLPDGAKVLAAFFFEGDRLVGADRGAEVRNGRYYLRFTLPEYFRFYSAGHKVEVSFSSSLHDYDEVESWKRDHSDLPWEELTDHAVSSEVYVGFPEEELADNRRVAAYYRSALPPAVELFQLLERRFEFTKNLKKSWDPFVVEMAVDTEEGWYGDGVVDRRGEFLETEWREFLDTRFRPRIRELIRQHSLLTEEKFPRVMVYMDRFLKDILSLSQMESLVIYKDFFGLPSDPRDFYHDDYKPSGDRQLLLRMIREYISVLRRFTDVATIVGGASSESDG